MSGKGKGGRAVKGKGQNGSSKLQERLKASATNIAFLIQTGEGVIAEERTAWVSTANQTTAAAETAGRGQGSGDGDSNDDEAGRRTLGRRGSSRVNPSD